MASINIPGKDGIIYRYVSLAGSYTCRILQSVPNNKCMNTVAIKEINAERFSKAQAYYDNNLKKYY